MPDVIEWLRNRIALNLPPVDLDAILHFALLYSLFEARALNEQGSPNAIIQAVDDWNAQGRLDIQKFQPALDYFRNRYFPNQQEDARFNELNVHPNNRARVVTGLSQQNVIPQESVVALLLVVHRLRNNLLHGIKWAYGLEGQGDNFRNSNLALIAALEAHGL